MRPGRGGELNPGNQRVDVGKLLARLGIEARRDGDEFLARCPGHEDAKPSWSIHGTTGKHHCFACGFGGTATSLVIHVLDMAQLAWTRRDAWEWMRDQGLLVGDGELGLDVELYLQVAKPTSFVLPAGVVVDAPLSAWPTPAARYVASRAIPGHQLRRWGVGYAVGGRLAGRVVFPVRDRRGRLLSYSARTFVGDPVRYLTPHESENPDHAALFGEQAWPAVGERRRVVVVEGAIKALAVERACSLHVAGVLGATQASNPSVIAKLATFPEVTILLDNDEAGSKAAHALTGALARHVRTSQVFLTGPAVDDAEPDVVRKAVA